MAGAHPFLARLHNYTQKWLPHSSAFFAEGWEAIKHRRTGAISLPHYKLECVTITHMATNRALAQQQETKKDPLTATKSVQRRNQLRILKAFGSVDFNPNYDYKAERSKKRSAIR
jgi:hypothetical protein